MDEMNELPDNIARALRELDDQAGRAAARLNPAHVAESVLHRLREPMAEIRLATWRLTMVRVAAAVVVILAGGATALRLARHSAASARSALPMGLAVDSLSSGDLSSLLTDVNDFGESGVLTQPATLDDLTEPELQRLLSQLP